MRRSWRTFALILLFGVWPQLGCVQVPADKSVQDLRPIQQNAGSAKKQELTAADISKSMMQQAELLEKTGKTGDAVAAYQKMRGSEGPDAQQATKKLALLYYRSGEMDRAEQEFLLLKQQNPKDASTLTSLGNINYQRGMWGTAEKCYRDALYHQADHVEAWTGLGMTLAQLEAYNDSVDALSKVVSKAEAYCCVARVLSQQGKRQDAVRAYETALTIDPAMQQAKMELARIQQTVRTDPPTTVTLTTHLKPENRAVVELEDAPGFAIEGASRLMMQRPTLPPVPELGSDRDWASSNKKK